MKTTSTSLLLTATLAVAGCSNGSSTTQSGTFAPIYHDGVKTEYNQLTEDEGLVVFTGHADGTVRQMRYRFNADKTILYIKDGSGEEVAYTTQVSSTYDNGTSYHTSTWTNDAGDRAEVYASNGAYGYVIPQDSSGVWQGLGLGGVETAVEDLPDNASYSGSYYAYSGENNSNYTYGTMAVNVDFANGDMDGTVSSGSISGVANSTYTGTIDGTVTGGRVSGTITATGDATGTLDMAGAATGASANRLMGGVGGTLTVDGTADTYGGYFIAN